MKKNNNNMKYKSWKPHSAHSASNSTIPIYFDKTCREWTIFDSLRILNTLHCVESFELASKEVRITSESVLKISPWVEFVRFLHYNDIVNRRIRPIFLNNQILDVGLYVLCKLAYFQKALYAITFYFTTVIPRHLCVIRLFVGQNISKTFLILLLNGTIAPYMLSKWEIRKPLIMGDNS